MSFDHIRGEGHTAPGREWDLMNRVADAMTAGLVPVKWEHDEQGYAYACLLGPKEKFPEHAAHEAVTSLLKSRGTSNE